MTIARRLSPLLLLASGACLAEELMDTDSREAVGSETAEIAGGTTVPVGQFDAVAQLGAQNGCSGTLISQSLVLTAAHCFCDEFGNGCLGSTIVGFSNILRLDNPNTPQNEGGRGPLSVIGRAVIHPDMAIGDILRNDLAVIRLDQPMSEVATVAPIPLAGAMPAIGSPITIVGYGHSNGSGGECSSPIGFKRQGTTPLDQRVVGPVGDSILVLEDPAIHTCRGDSGGPGVDSLGRVAGVISSSTDFTSNTNLRAVPAYLEWIGLQGNSPGGRVGVWDLSGAAPAAANYADDVPDQLGLLGWIDATDVRLTGDFFDRGYDQVLYINRGGVGGRLRIADYADGEGPTESLYWEDYANGSIFTGWIDRTDEHLVGDFLDRGHDQLLLINRSGTGGRVMIVGFETGQPVVHYLESYGQDISLNGWHDGEDGLLVGDFFGDGHDSVLFVNRGPGNGRILIADFSDGQVPITWRYFEAYSDGVLLNGWHDAGDLLFAGDFRGLGRDQVLFVNRGSGNGRVLITDFGDGAFPAEWQLLLSYAQATALDGWLDTEDVALAGRFRLGTRDQLALINRTPAGLGRVQVADLSGSGITIPFAQNQVPAAGIIPRVHQNDHILAGDLRDLGHAQLLTLEGLEL